MLANVLSVLSRPNHDDPGRCVHDAPFPRTCSVVARNLSLSTYWGHRSEAVCEMNGGTVPGMLLSSYSCLDNGREAAISPGLLLCAGDGWLSENEELHGGTATTFIASQY